MIRNPKHLWRFLLPLVVLVGLALRFATPLHLSRMLRPGDQLGMLDGFYPPEYEPDGTSFRWTGNQTVLRAPFAGHKIIRLRLAAPTWQPETSIRLALGDQHTHVSLAPGLRVLELLAPPAPDGLPVRLETDPTPAPRDQRSLGLKLYAVEFTRLGGWATVEIGLLILTLLLAGVLAYGSRPSLPILLLLVLLPSSQLIPILGWVLGLLMVWITCSTLFRRVPVLPLMGVAALAMVAAWPGMLTTTNDGSHYALLRALGDNQSPIIDDFISYAGTRDVALRDGHYYSDRPPGTAFVLLPIYLLARPFATANALPAFEALFAATVMIGTAAVGCLYFVGRKSGASPLGASIATLAFALGTIHWKYSTVLYSHALSALLSTVVLLLTLTVQRPWQLVGLGLALGYGVVVEYTFVLLLPPVLIYVAWRVRRRTGWVLLGVGIGILPLVLYNRLAFGHPFQTGYTYHATFEWARRFGDTFVYPLPTGLGQLLLDQGSVVQGLLSLSPILLLVPPGVVVLGRRSRPQAWLWVGLVLPTLLLIATHRTLFGGSDRDPRYLAAIIPLLCWPLGMLATTGRRSRTVFWIASSGLLTISVLNQLVHLAYTNGHSIVRLPGPHTIWNTAVAWDAFLPTALPHAATTQGLMIIVGGIGVVAMFVVYILRLLTNGPRNRRKGVVNGDMEQG